MTTSALPSGSATCSTEPSITWRSGKSNRATRRARGAGSTAMMVAPVEQRTHSLAPPVPAPRSTTVVVGSAGIAATCRAQRGRERRAGAHRGREVGVVDSEHRSGLVPPERRPVEDVRAVRWSGARRRARPGVIGTGVDHPRLRHRQSHALPTSPTKPEERTRRVDHPSRCCLRASSARRPPLRRYVGPGADDPVVSERSSTAPDSTGGATG